MINKKNIGKKIKQFRTNLRKKLDLIRIILTKKKTIEKLEENLLKEKVKCQRLYDKLNIDKWEIRSYKLQIQAIEKYLKKNPNEDLQKIIDEVKL